MKDITPRHSHDSWRRQAGKTMPWQWVCDEIAQMVAKHPCSEPLLKLAKSLADSPAAAELYSTYSLSGWIITDTPHLHWNDNILLVRYDARKKRFEFEHRTLAKHNDIQDCSEAEGPEKLKLFLRYKYGVLFEPTPQT